MRQPTFLWSGSVLKVNQTRLNYKTNRQINLPPLSSYEIVRRNHQHIGKQGDLNNVLAEEFSQTYQWQQAKWLTECEMLPVAWVGGLDDMPQVKQHHQNIKSASAKGKWLRWGRLRQTFVYCFHHWVSIFPVGSSPYCCLQRALLTAMTISSVGNVTLKKVISYSNSLLFSGLFCLSKFIQLWILKKKKKGVGWRN